jgi:hypothetical protein
MGTQGDQIGRIFAPFIGDCLHTLGIVLKITEVGKATFWATFFPRYQFWMIFEKIGWAIFWATFSETRLVTLSPHLHKYIGWRI